MDSSPANPIHSEVDFEAPGLHAGYLRLPHSSHRSAYGWIPIPVASARHGAGPTVLLMGGNHGDEYEGQVVLGAFLRELEIERVAGHIIILPRANAPAARAGTRTSPLDGGNLNRLFPGRPDGTPTQVIAHYIEHTLLARSDYLLDLHAGGSSLHYLPTALVPREGDARRDGERRRLVEALGLPYAVWEDDETSGPYSASAALRQGVIGLTVEVGGSGRLSPRSVDTATRVLRRYLGATGVYAVADETGTPPAPPRFFGSKAHCYARHAGLFEPLVEPGQAVSAGQRAALLHDLDRPWERPVELSFDTSGVVLCRRAPAPAEPGDCLFELGVET